MRKAPTPPKKTNPLIVGGGAVVLVGLLYYAMSGSAPAPATTTKKPTKKSTALKAGEYPESDHTAKFAPQTVLVADVFNPLVKKPVSLPSAPVVTNAAPGGIPVELTGGQGIWYYTGWVELDGRRQALLENPTTGETEYVSAGESWKQARIGTIDVSTVVLIGPSGKSYPIKIQDYGVVPGQAPAPAEKVQPLNVPPVAIAGAIGSPGAALGVRPVAGSATMTLPDGRTIQVPLDANAAAAATDANAGAGNGRRRNRRNRSNNSGDFNNAP